MLKIKFLLSLLLIFQISFAQTIKLAPLPMKPKDDLIGEYIPLINYLNKKTGLKIEIAYIESYEKIIEEFKNGNIHMAVLGPIPYLKLVQSYDKLQSIVTIKEKNGNTADRCVLVTSPVGPKSVKEIKGPIALPQKLSTCGEFSANIILSKYSKDLNSLGYKNFKDHNQAIEAMLRGEFEVAVAKEEITEEYKGYGIIAIAYSPFWPSLTIVANTKNLNRDDIEIIKKALLSASWKDLKNFGIGKYGFSEVIKEQYEELFKYKRFIPQ